MWCFPTNTLLCLSFRCWFLRNIPIARGNHVLSVDIMIICSIVSWPMMGIVACLVKDARDRGATNKETGTRWTVSPAGHLTYQPIVWFIVPLFYNWHEQTLAHLTSLLYTGQSAEYGSTFSLLRLVTVEMVRWVVPWPRRLVAGLLARWLGFITRPVHVGFCGGNCGSKTGFSLSTSDFPCLHSSTSAAPQ